MKNSRSTNTFPYRLNQISGTRVLFVAAISSMFPYAQLPAGGPGRLRRGVRYARCKYSCNFQTPYKIAVSKRTPISGGIVVIPIARETAVKEVESDAVYAPWYPEYQPIYRRHEYAQRPSRAS